MRWLSAAVIVGVLAGACTLPASAIAAPEGAGSGAGAATPVVTLNVAGSVAGPYQAAEASITLSVSEGGDCPIKWELQKLVGSSWANVFDPADSTGYSCGGPGADVGYAWSPAPGQVTYRAYVPAQGLLVAPAYSAPVTVQVGTAKPPQWLSQLNALRALNDAPAVPLDPALDTGAWHHARYMYRNQTASHAENPRNKWYTADGNAAGQAGDDYYGSLRGTGGALKIFAEAPYHQNIEIDPSAVAVGYGTFRNGAASLTEVWNIAYSRKGPYFEFPANGKTTSLRRYWGAETPDPTANCPAAWQRREYWAEPIGLPMEYSAVSGWSGGGANERVRATLTSGGKSLRICAFHSYSGVTFMLPLLPLTRGRSYQVSVRYDGKVKARWHFRVAR